MRNIQSLPITVLLMLQASTVTFLFSIHSAFQRRENEVAVQNEKMFELKTECKAPREAPQSAEYSQPRRPPRVLPQSSHPAPAKKQVKNRDKEREAETAKIRTNPATLASVWVLPHPPQNAGRFIRFESFTDRIGPGGQEYFVFKEWTGDRFVETVVLSSELRWDVRP